MTTDHDHPQDPALDPEDQPEPEPERMISVPLSTLIAALSLDGMEQHDATMELRRRIDDATMELRRRIDDA